MKGVGDKMEVKWTNWSIKEAKEERRTGVQ